MKFLTPLFSIFVLLMLPLLMTAQSGRADEPLRVYKSGQLDARVGIGVLPTYLADRNRVEQAFPAIYAALDYRLTDNFTLGAYYGRSDSETIEYIFSDGVRGSWLNNTQTYGLRAAFHLSDKVKNADFYGGFTIGRTKALIDCSDPTMERMQRYMGIEAINSRTVMSGFLGGAYTFTKRFGAFAEIGAGGIALARAGVNVRIF